MTTRRARSLDHHRSLLWIAAIVHRLSGLGLATFLPLHFLALGLALDGEGRLDTFLTWTKQPLVKAAESGLMFLLVVHLLGGLRLLLLENRPRPLHQRRFAAAAVALSVVVTFAFLARVF